MSQCDEYGLMTYCTVDAEVFDRYGHPLQSSQFILGNLDARGAPRSDQQSPTTVIAFILAFRMTRSWEHMHSKLPLNMGGPMQRFPRKMPYERSV